MGVGLIRDAKHVLRSVHAMNTAQRLLLVLLAETSRDEKREGFPGMVELAELTGLAPSSVRRHLAALESAGLIERVSMGTDKAGRPVYATRGHATVYRLTMASAPGPIPLGAPPEGAQFQAPSDEERRSVLNEMALSSERKAPSSERPPVSPVTEPSSSGRASNKDDLGRVVDAIFRRADQLGHRIGPEREVEITREWARELVDTYCRRRPAIEHPFRWALACLARETSPSAFLPIPQPPRFVREAA